MIALRIAGHPDMARDVVDQLVSCGNLNPAMIRLLPEDAAFPRLTSQDVIITTPLDVLEARQLGPLSSVDQAPPRRVVCAVLPDFAEALEQIALGADDYVPITQPASGLVGRLLSGAKPGSMPALESSRLEALLSLFDQAAPETAEQWRELLGRVATFLDVDAVGLLAPGAPTRRYEAEGERQPIRELIVIPFAISGQETGRLLLARYSPRQKELEAIARLGSIVGRLLGQQVQRADLGSKVLGAKQEWEATVDAIQDPIVVLDRQGRVIRANLAFAALVRHPIREVVDRSVNALCRLEEDASWWRTGRALAGTGVQTLAFPVEPGRWFEVHALELSHGRTGSIVYLRDITEERRLMALIMQGERFAALGELAEGIFHDLTGLTTDLQLQLSCARMSFPTVRAFVESGGMTGDLAAEAQGDLEGLAESLSNASTAALRLGQVLNNLRQYSRLRKDTGGGQASPLDLNMLIQALPALFSARAREKGARIRLELQDVPLVSGNASELMRVFENLLKNALDALPKGGEIQLVTSSRGEHVRIEVRDTGHGIPLELQEKIFERGYTTRQASGGTGLGLFICRQLLQAHGGHVSVDSRPGQGAVFVVELPVFRESETAA